MNSAVQRYDPIHYFDQGDSAYGQMRKVEDGDFVSYDDYILLERELNASNSEIKRLREWLESIADLSSDATAVGMAESALEGKETK